MKKGSWLTMISSYHLPNKTKVNTIISNITNKERKIKERRIDMTEKEKISIFDCELELPGDTELIIIHRHSPQPKTIKLKGEDKSDIAIHEISPLEEKLL